MTVQTSVSPPGVWDDAIMLIQRDGIEDPFMQLCQARHFAPPRVRSDALFFTEYVHPDTKRTRFKALFEVRAEAALYPTADFSSTAVPLQPLVAGQRVQGLGFEGRLDRCRVQLEDEPGTQGWLQLDAIRNVKIPRDSELTLRRTVMSDGEPGPGVIEVAGAWYQAVSWEHMDGFVLCERVGHFPRWEPAADGRAVAPRHPGEAWCRVNRKTMQYSNVQTMEEARKDMMGALDRLADELGGPFVARMQVEHRAMFQIRRTG